MSLQSENDAWPPSIPTPPRQRQRQRQRQRRLSLALQGGGAFGAFTWGVLDKLLEEDFRFDAVSGASAGSINAVLLASGLADGGTEGARASLQRFWTRTSRMGARARLIPKPAGAVLAAVTKELSPYALNPLGLNPLRTLLSAEVDFAAVRNSPVRLLLAATRVRDGALRIFRNSAITSDVVLASACLPHLHHAVSIDGEPHWDGGFAANPPVMPLVNATRASDVLIVQIMPTTQNLLPKTSGQIDKRLAQITFSSSIQKDMETLALLKELASAEGQDNRSKLGRKLSKLHIHKLAAEDYVQRLGDLSILNTDRQFLLTLRDHGRQAAAAWMRRL